MSDCYLLTDPQLERIKPYFPRPHYDPILMAFGARVDDQRMNDQGDTLLIHLVRSTDFSAAAAVSLKIGSDPQALNSNDECALDVAQGDQTEILRNWQSMQQMA